MYHIFLDFEDASPLEIITKKFSMYQKGKVDLPLLPSNIPQLIQTGNLLFVSTYYFPDALRFSYIHKNAKQLLIGIFDKLKFKLKFRNIFLYLKIAWLPTFVTPTPPTATGTFLQFPSVVCQ